MRTIYSIIIFLFSVISVFAQTEESNKYFNQGMELYNQGKYTEAVPCFEKSDSLYKATLDSTSQHRIDILLYKSACLCFCGEVKEATKSFLLIHKISLENKKVKFTGTNASVLCLTILQNCNNADNYYSFLDKMIYMASLAKEDKNDSLWSTLVSNKISALQSERKFEEAYKYTEKAYEEINSTSVFSINLFELSDLMGQSLWRKAFFINNKEIKNKLLKQRMCIYTNMLSIANELWGNKSFKYGNVLYKIADTYLGTGINIDRNKGRRILLQAFDLMTDSINLATNLHEAIETITEAYIPFDIADANIDYLKYLQGIIKFTPKELVKSELLEILAKTLRKTKETENIKKSIDLYTQLIGQSDNFRKRTIYLSQRAMGYYSINDIQGALCDYLSIDSIYKNNIIKDYLEESSSIKIKEDIARLYRENTDSLKYREYHNLYCNMSEKLIENIVTDKVANLGVDFEDDYKLEIIWNYANTLFNVTNHNQKDINKATNYYKLYLQVLPKFNPIQTPKKELKRNAFTFLSHIYCYQKDFKQGFYYASKLYKEALADNDTICIINALTCLSIIYGDVSVEPELSLDYKLKSCEMQSLQLCRKKDSILKEQYIVNYDMILQDWANCAKLFRYLGDENGFNISYKKLFYYINQIEGKENAHYIEAKKDWYDYKLQKVLGDRTKNQQAHLLCDSIALFYKENFKFMNWKYYNYGSIAQNYFFAHDTITAKKYYDLYKNEIQLKYGDKYQTSNEYIELQRTLADILPLKEKIARLKQIESMYSKLGKECHNQLLHDLVYYLKEIGNVEEEYMYLNKIISLFPNDNYALHRLTECYRQNGDYAKIESMYETLCKVSKEELFSDIKSGTAEYRETVWKSYYDIPFCLGEALAESFNDKISTSTIYDNIVLRKNFLLNASISAENLIKSDGDSLLLAKYERKIRLEQKLRENNSNIIEDLGRSIPREQAEKLVVRFNDEIMKRAAMLGDYTSSLFVGWKTIQKKLGKDDIAIEFSKYNSFDGKISYGAAILQNVGEPIFIALCKEDEINRIPKTKLYTMPNLYKIIWKPLEQFFANKKNIYFSPDGQLFNIAIEVVPSENGSCSIGEKYNVYRIASTRELTQKRINQLYKNAVIYGGLRYNTDAKSLEADSKKYPLRDFSVDTFEIADSLQLRSGVEYLPATKEEALNIDKKLETIHVGTKLLIDSIGTETSFKNMSGGNLNILHIATHGFYWTKTEAQQRSDLSFLTLLKQGKKDNTEDKALTRSGLLFAGANNALMGKRLPKGIDDGILTAKEISELDLRGLDMVVLSACQTGLGEITGDGVFGLQRGFKKAGAKTLMMSLWKVDDKATQLLMSRFYSNLITGKSKIESLRDAQKYVREYETEVEIKSDNKPAISAHAKVQAQQSHTQQKVIKKVHPYQNPKYWAAFILLDALN